MSKKKKKQPKPKSKRTRAKLEHIANQKPTSLSHAWLIGAAKKALDKLNNT